MNKEGLEAEVKEELAMTSKQKVMEIFPNAYSFEKEGIWYIAPKKFYVRTLTCGGDRSTEEKAWDDALPDAECWAAKKRAARPSELDLHRRAVELMTIEAAELRAEIATLSTIGAEQIRLISDMTRMVRDMQRAMMVHQQDHEVKPCGQCRLLIGDADLLLAAKPEVGK